MAETGIRELRNHLSRYLERVQEGEEVTVTDRGTAVARIIPVTRPRPLDQLIEEGLVERAPVGRRTRPAHQVATRGTISDLVADQRR